MVFGYCSGQHRSNIYRAEGGGNTVCYHWGKTACIQKFESEGFMNYISFPVSGAYDESEKLKILMKVKVRKKFYGEEQQ